MTGIDKMSAGTYFHRRQLNQRMSVLMKNILISIILSGLAAGCTKERSNPVILMKTSKGDIRIELEAEKAPMTVTNFLGYVESGHFKGTVFHRVIDGFMIQGGGFDENMQQKPAPQTVENEATNGLKNVVGSVAMARTPDPHSASAQFFINVNDNVFLDYPGQDGWGYCVFGHVVEGMDVVDEIKGVPTGNHGPHQNVPVDSVTILEVSVVD
jgi:cyclophilin family peptidyl-prolyl cis-trans isomerase